MKTAYVWDERYVFHDTGAAAGALPSGGWLQPDLHVEHGDAKRRIHSLLCVSGVLDAAIQLRPRQASPDDLERVHDAAYVARIRAQSADRGGDAGDGAPFGPGSFDIACLAAGGVMTATEAVIAGEARNAYALVRPCGHHAVADQGGGFCLFNNVAVTIRWAQAVLGLERIAVVDWDVHHGNGTQDIFYDDPTVLALSIHQDRCCWSGDAGQVDETGSGSGTGFTLNVPLPAGAGHGAYLATMRDVVQPALARFAPELILVSCGFDANILDPLGRQRLRSDGYRQMTEMLMAVADELCDGRLVLAHEGGYSATYVPWCVLAVMEALMGTSTGLADPFLEQLKILGGDVLEAHEGSVLAAAARVASSVREPTRHGELD